MADRAREERQPPPPAPPIDLVGEAFTEAQLIQEVHKLRRAYLECRTLGHSWRIAFMGPVSRSGDTDLMTRARRHPWNPDGARVIRCTRCRTERIDLCVVGYGRATYSYRLVSRAYRYPDEYRVPGVNQHRDLLHEELFARLEEGDE